MKRLFIAIDPPREIKQEITRNMQELQNDNQNQGEYKWIPPEQIHLTLAFLGDIQINQYSLIKEQLSKVKIKPFNLEINGLDFFSRGKLAHILFLKIQNEDRLINLQKEITKILLRIKIRPDKKKFRPHITVGRSKTMDITQAKKIVQKFENSNSGLLPRNFNIFDFTLYSSILNSKGAMHYKEAIYGLEE